MVLALRTAGFDCASHGFKTRDGGPVKGFEIAYLFGGLIIAGGRSRHI